MDSISEIITALWQHETIAWLVLSAVMAGFNCGCMDLKNVVAFQSQLIK